MRSAGKTFALCVLLLSLVTMPAATRAAGFTFADITSLAGGPGHGAMPSLNRWGDIVFVADDSVFVFHRAGRSFTNLMRLPGAPARGWHPRLSDTGDVAFIDPDDRHVWHFEANGEVFTDLAAQAGFPGTSGLHSLYGAFDMNSNGHIALHAGDLNFGSIFVYDLATGMFSPITGLPGAPFRGRDCSINDPGQVAYNGFPDIYVTDPADSTTVNITDLPGGPGTGLGGMAFNNAGDISLSTGGEMMVYQAATGTFHYLSTLPGFPVAVGSVDRNGMADDGALSFWADEIYFFDPADSTFTQLTSQGVVPFPGHESKVNNIHQVAFEAGGGIWLATPAASPVMPLVAGKPLLAQNRPNPFNPVTSIAYEVPSGGAAVRLEILDVRGGRVRTLVAEHQDAGSRQVSWNGRDDAGRAVPSGTYLYRLRAGKMVTARSMQLIK